MGNFIFDNLLIIGPAIVALISCFLLLQNIRKYQQELQSLTHKKQVEAETESEAELESEILEHQLESNTETDTPSPSSNTVYGAALFLSVLLLTLAGISAQSRVSIAQVGFEELETSNQELRDKIQVFEEEQTKLVTEINDYKQSQKTPLERLKIEDMIDGRMQVAFGWVPSSAILSLEVVTPSGETINEASANGSKGGHFTQDPMNGTQTIMWSDKRTPKGKHRIIIRHVSGGAAQLGIKIGMNNTIQEYEDVLTSSDGVLELNIEVP